MGLHRVEPRPEAVRAGVRAGALRPTGRELTASRRLVVRRRGCPALPEDLGGDPLGHLAHRPAVAKEVRAALDVNEAGCHDEPAHVEPLLRREPTERSGRPDSRDAVAGDGDVAEEPGRAGAVDDMTILEDQVEFRLWTRRGARWVARARGEDETSSEGEATNHRSNDESGSNGVESPHGASVRHLRQAGASTSSWRGACGDPRGGGAGTRLRRPPLAAFEPTGTRHLSWRAPVPRRLSLLARRRLRRAPAPDGTVSTQTRLATAHGSWPAAVRGVLSTAV